MRTVGLGLAFGASGGAGLLAEQAFEKLLGTLLGTSTPAGAVVLATYFGGLTLGAWLYARGRSRGAGPATFVRAFATYAKLEAAIALACAVLATCAGDLIPWFVPLLRLGVGSSAALLGLRIVVAACWVLPVTIPMGATFPAIVDALDVLPEGARRAGVSAFYAFNLAGALAAAAFGPYLVFPRFGVDGALALAALLDGGAAAVALESVFAYGRPRALSFAPADDDRAARAEANAGVGEAASANGERGASTTPLVVVAALTGFVVFSLEVVWTHLIGAVLGGSVYAFGTMLAVVLAGLGLGAAIGGAIGVRLGRVPRILPGAALAIAALTLWLGHGTWPEAPHALAQIGKQAFSFSEAERARAEMAVRLLLAPSTALGTVYPLVLRLEAFPAANAGPVAARMGAANALACIAGALWTGFVGIPLLGSERVLLALTGLCVVGAGAIAFPTSKKWTGRSVLAALCTLGIAALCMMPRWDRLHLTSGEQVYFRRTFVFPETKLLSFHEDTRGGITTVIENVVGEQRSRVLLTNGKFQGNDSAEILAQDGFALAPMLFVQNWTQALVIGLGTGRSANVVATMGFEHVAIAELAPGIVEAARRDFGDLNGHVLDRPNVELLLEDGRNALLLSDRAYDLVTVEITSVWLAGQTNIYTREFYRLVKARLRPGGVMQQWVQLHHVTLEEVATVLASMREAFPHVSLFVLGGQGVLVGTAEPQLTRAGFFSRLEAHGAALGERDLRARVASLHGSRLLSPRELDAFVAKTRPAINTDQNRRLEYSTPRHAFERYDRQADNLRALADGSGLGAQPVADDAVGELAEVARAVDPRSVRTEIGLSPR